MVRLRVWVGRESPNVHALDVRGLVIRCVVPNVNVAGFVVW
jgi:hypothetical protein